MSEGIINHSAEFRRRRFLNWFPMGLTYAFLYMGRYNLTVAKNSLGDMMTKEDFGVIFGVGTLVYAIAFLLNGPLTDKMGGKKAILAASAGSGLTNLIMGLFIWNLVVYPGSLAINLVTAMSVMYAINMYFQSFAAVAIVKVNSAWFHVRERGGFSGIFGTMISSGIFFAFTVNGWVLDMTAGWGPGGSKATWWVFLLPSAILFTMFVVELVLLRDSPSGAGLQDFDTGDASSGEAADIKLFTIVKKVLTNPIILTVALIEFCTGIIRNGVMHWFPIYAQEVWALPSQHLLRNGSWSAAWLIGLMFAVAAIFFIFSRRYAGQRKAALIVSGALCALAPFVQAGWGGILFVAGVIGGNVAGWVSDLFFQSRRAPAAAGLYAMLALCLVGMYFTLGDTTPEVGWTKKADYALKTGDTVISVNGRTGLKNWTDVSKAVGCIPSRCDGEGVVWDTTACMCTATPKTTAAAGTLTPSDGTIHLTVERGGATVAVELKDTLAAARAGDARRLDAGPVLTLTPLFMGLILFLVSLGVIGTHGLLSGTATMDFGGRKGAATAVGMIDGFVYLGTAVQSVSLGYLTSRSWSYWPLFLVPFAFIGFFLLLRIWNAKPKGSGGH